MGGVILGKIRVSAYIYLYLFLYFFRGSFFCGGHVWHDTCICMFGDSSVNKNCLGLPLCGGKGPIFAYARHIPFILHFYAFFCCGTVFALYYCIIFRVMIYLLEGNMIKCIKIFGIVYILLLSISNFGGI